VGRRQLPLCRPLLCTINYKKYGKGELEMNIESALKSKREGSSLVLVMLVVVILLFIGGGLLSLGLHGRMQTIRASSEITARCAADAGLTKAVFELNQRMSDTSSDYDGLPHAIAENLANCDATFSYKVAATGGSRYVVQSIGTSSRGDTKTVNATLRLAGIFEYGILVKDTIKLYSGTTVDGYDSDNPGDTDVPVQIATTSTDAGDISLMPGATVDGEVLVGVDGYFPVVTAPVLADMNAPIVVKGRTVLIGPEDSGKYTYISLENAAQPTVLLVTGKDVVLHITGDISMGQGCELQIAPDSSLAIYLEGDLVAGNSAGINNDTALATSFKLYGIGEDQNFDLKAKADWYGAVYAPNADITIKAGANTYGAFIGTSFENKAGGFVMYDSALSDVSETDVAVRYVVERWFEGQANEYFSVDSTTGDGQRLPADPISP
jgi:Tfp pilus assembly protein PilX